MKNFLKSWLGIYDIEDQLGQLGCDIENGLSNLEYSLKNEEGNPNMNYRLHSMNGTFSLDDTPYEIISSKHKLMVAEPGHPTALSAQLRAEELAKENPTEEFIVFGPLSVSKANIPVVSTSWDYPVESSKED